MVLKIRNFAFVIGSLVLTTVANASVVKVATVPAEHTRTSSMYSNPVSLQNFKFELNSTLSRVRLDIDYTDGPGGHPKPASCGHFKTGQSKCDFLA